MPVKIISRIETDMEKAIALVKNKLRWRLLSVEQSFEFIQVQTLFRNFWSFNDNYVSPVIMIGCYASHTVSVSSRRYLKTAIMLAEALNEAKIFEKEFRVYKDYLE